MWNNRGVIGIADIGFCFSQYIYSNLNLENH